MMATKVGPATVSYGIGVQNRYSAFLEDEDSFALSNIIKRPTNEHQAVNKQKGSANSSKSTSTKASRSDSSNNQNKKQEGQQKNSPSQGNGQQIKGDIRRQQRDGKPSQNQSSGGSQPARNYASRPRGYNQDGTANTNGSQRFPRNQYNGPHQQTDSAVQQHSKENHGNLNNRPMRSNIVRTNPRPRIENTRATPQNQDGPQINSHLASNDEEKARRQQKRLNNLRFKDPEKRERRNQTTSDGAVDQQAKATEQSEERPADQRGPRNRRDADKNRVRPRRSNPNGESNGDSVRRDNRREKPNRQRGDFAGSDAGSKPEKPKPIPNFSDKLDFPSLAS